jgi:hypothetical protein
MRLHQAPSAPEERSMRLSREHLVAEELSLASPD